MTRPFLICLFVVTVTAPQIFAQELKAPWEVPGYQRGPLLKSISFSGACPTPPPVIRDLFGVSYYEDSSHSVVDPRLKKQNEEALKPVRDYLQSVSHMAEVYFAHPENKPAADCAFSWLKSWAMQSGLLGQTNDQGAYEKKWILAGLAFAYLRIRGSSPMGGPTDAVFVASWLKNIALQVWVPYDHSKSTTARNNHAYWAGFAVGLAGIASGDVGLWNWGVSKFDLGVSQIQPDGTLPLELARGKRATHYHHFALFPLVMLGEFGAANQQDLYSHSNGAIQKLVRLLTDSLQAGVIRSLTGVDQESIEPSGQSWIEAWFARFGGESLKAVIQSARPMRNSRLKADMTLSFGKALK